MICVSTCSRKTQWFDPRDKHTKPTTVADCIGDELPYGWEMAYSPTIGVYYIDHINRRNQLEDPREECRNMQIRMLESYMRQAESLDPISTSSVSLATGSQQQDQSLERLNSSLLQLELADQTPAAASLSYSLQQHNHQSIQHQQSPSERHTDRDREVLQQSLLDSKSRVAQLKRELDTNARLLTLIERYKTRDDEFAVQV